MDRTNPYEAVTTGPPLDDIHDIEWWLIAETRHLEDLRWLFMRQGASELEACRRVADLLIANPELPRTRYLRWRLITRGVPPLEAGRRAAIQARRETQAKRSV